MPSQLPLTNVLNWETSDYDQLSPVVQKINWANLCQRASNLNYGLPCLPLKKMTNGFNDLVCIL
ncbi:hypothetical protein GGR58DRAFT_462874 [Xylaria digitata]|nr:hypothetical protein GGR58DRAFT_462874 [Xylaria digitata]